MAEVGGGGLSMADVQAMMPKPANAAPPAVQADSSTGDDLRYALANHTHESRLQARRVQVTPNAQGQFTYVFPRPYDSGVVPIVQVTAETPAGAGYRNDASVIQGATTNIQTQILITRLNQTISVAGLGISAPLFSAVTASVWVNIMSRAPS